MMFTSLVAASVLVQHVQMRPAGVTRIHFLEFAGEFGAVVDKKFLSERVEPMTLTKDEDEFFRDLLSDSRPARVSVDESRLRMVVNAGRSGEIVADCQGRWARYETGMHAMVTYELSAPALILLDRMLVVKYPTIQRYDNGKPISIPQLAFAPRRYSADGKFEDIDLSTKITSVSSRSAWPPIAREELKPNVDPRMNEDGIRHLLSYGRMTAEPLDWEHPWFHAETASGIVIRGDINGRVQISAPGGKSQTYDLPAPKFIALDALLKQTYGKHLSEANPPLAKGRHITNDVRDARCQENIARLSGSLCSSAI